MEILKEYWFLLVSVVGLAGWLYRLEARILSHDREITRIWEQRREDVTVGTNQRREDQAAAKESRDATNSLLNEMRNDIKTLLRTRHGQ